MAFKRTASLDAYLRELGLDGTPARLPELPSPGGKVSERELTREVIEYAQGLGYLVAHFRPARVLRGGKETYETPVAADGKGWPDLFLAKAPYCFALEVKVPPNKPTKEQRRWLDALNAAFVYAAVVTPANLSDVKELLRGK